MWPPAASPTAATRSAIAAVVITAGTSGAPTAYSAAATSTLAPAPAVATALGAPATAAMTSSRTTPAAAFARKERLLGRPGRPLRPFRLRKGGAHRTDHTDGLGPVVIIHRLQHCLDMAVLVRQRANKMCMQEGIRDSHPLLSNFVVRVSSNTCSASMRWLLEGMVNSWNLSYSF